jgi:predicted membrane channel-forming protein YqfA (hemolysin III family)
MRLPFDISQMDRLGARVSFLCAVHCAIVPFAATILPLLGLGFLADARIERIVVSVSIALACMSVCWGIRIHRQRRVVILFGAALFLITAGRGYAKDDRVELAMVVPGAALFVCAHRLNLYLCRKCRRCAND